MPRWKGWPAKAAPRSLTRNGTPRNGPSGRSSAAAARPSSKSGWMTALRSGLSASIRSIAASTSSLGLASPERTSSAWAVASRRARSSAMAADPTRPLTAPGAASEPRLQRRLGRLRRRNSAKLVELVAQPLVDAAPMPVDVAALARRMRVANDDVLGADRHLATAARTPVELSRDGADQHQFLALGADADEAPASVGKVIERLAAHRYRSVSSPTVNGSASPPTLRIASRTPGMNELRS